MELSDANSELAQAVFHLAQSAAHFTDADLGQPYQWGAHREGVRFALIGAMHELRTLAVAIAADRRRAANPLTRAHHALAQYHAAYRDLDAVLLGLSADDANMSPAVGEWSIRDTLHHMVGVQRNFFALVHYGLRRQREAGELPARLPEGEADRVLSGQEGLGSLRIDPDMDELIQYHARLHDRSLSEFASIAEEEIDGPSIWWEGEPFSLEYRIHRMEAHLRQHTVQIEKSLDQLSLPATEARRLLRHVFAALAEVEGLLIGASMVNPTLLHAVAESIHRLADDAGHAVGRANGMLAAVTGGDRERVKAMVDEEPHLANVRSRDGVSVTRLAVYYGQREIADILTHSSDIELDIWDGAALGRLAAVEEDLHWAGDDALNAYSRDGYTPLQLACFFGHEQVAAHLINAGANVNAASRNSMVIQPIHAATAGNHLSIVRLLLQSGADPNAVQQDSFRPLHSAAQNGNLAMARLLLEHGADPTLPDAKGQLPRELAEETENPQLIALLS